MPGICAVLRTPTELRFAVKEKRNYEAGATGLRYACLVLIAMLSVQLVEVSEDLRGVFQTIILIFRLWVSCEKTGVL